MTSKDFQLLFANALSTQENICHILNSDNSLLISCTDKSDFFINILESKQKFARDDRQEKFANEYLATHSDEEFAQDILSLTSSHPGFFLYFMVFMKLKEMGIIDNFLFDHLNTSIVYYEDELNAFIAKIFSRLSTNGNEAG